MTAGDLDRDDVPGRVLLIVLVAALVAGGLLVLGAVGLMRAVLAAAP